MTFTFIDIVLLVIILAFVFFGLFFGLIHTLASLLTTVLGLIIAMNFADPAFHRFGFMMGGGDFARIVTFVFVFFLSSRVLSILLKILGGLFSWFTYVPFAMTINRMFGAIFGFIEGLIVVGVILFYAMQVLPEDTLLFAIKGSFLAKYLVAMMSAMQVFLK